MNLTERAEKEVYKIIKKILSFSLCSLRALRDIYFRLRICRAVPSVANLNSSWENPQCLLRLIP